MHILSAAFEIELNMAIIRSISGLRVTQDALTRELISSYARAFSHYIPSGPIVIGRDGRPSGKWMEDVIIETLISEGRDVVSLGIAPTPTVQLETEHSSAKGGIAITASHNPSEWNGMKFLNESGVFLNAKENAEFWKELDSEDQSIIQSKGTLTVIEQPIQKHIASIHKALLSLCIDIPSSSKELIAVVDAVNASGSAFVPELLESLDCTCIPLYCDGTGVFPHLPEPLTENLGALMSAVQQHKADIGIAVDPDADRLVLIDEHGNAIGEEKTIALCVKSLITCAIVPHHAQSIALNMSTSSMSEYIAEEYGWSVYRTPVGEINVVESMKIHQCIIGGEGSGGVIVPATHFGRDSLVGLALIIALMKNTSKSLSELAASLPDLCMVKGKMSWSGSADKLFEEIERHFIQSLREKRIDDGIWLKLDAGWIHVRLSNTEPILRYIVECRSENETQTIVESLIAIISTHAAS